MNGTTHTEAPNGIAARKEEVRGQLSSTHLNGTAAAAVAPAAEAAAAADEGSLPDAATVERHRKEWFIPASLSSARTLNPIRAIVDKLQLPANSSKKLIPLSIGDPTVFGNLHPPATATAELAKIITAGSANGYAPSTGTLAARTAIAQRFSTSPYGSLTPNDVMICSGASGAIQIVMDAMLDAGDNILLPKPGFSLYATIAGYLNVEVRYYDLLPEKNWECDLEQMATLVDERTRVLLVNNPSNPNGSNFKREHLEEILAFAERFKLPIISDEIYADMVFSGNVFTPLADVSRTVPIVAIGGIAKQYVVPGWRVGWALWHDRDGKLAAARNAANSLTQIILGSNTLIQALLPSLLLDTPKDYYTTLNATLEEQSMFLYDSIRQIRGLVPILPQGAMYLMIRIRTEEFEADLSDDVKFSNALLQEEMLFVLPGSCFLAPNFMRLVTCAPKAIMEQAVARLKAFCDRHYKENKQESK